jgi:3-deoxy-D-manno-octulosonate 8-phosphate phosphatase (KDO 8-P phosphatase)
MLRLNDRIRRIKMLILDVDGVMTDGGIILGTGSMELKRFDARDGMGIALAKAAGLRIGILTIRDSEAVRKRAIELGIEEVQQGVLQKEEGYEAILKKHGLRDEEIAYMGDDIPDIPILRRAGLSVCVADGAEEARQVSHYVTRSRGGKGAVREVVNMLLKEMGKKEEAILSVLNASKGRAGR